jgi:hypothetical protein
MTIDGLWGSDKGGLVRLYDCTFGEHSFITSMNTDMFNFSAYGDILNLIEFSAYSLWAQFTTIKPIMPKNRPNLYIKRLSSTKVSNIYIFTGYSITSRYLFDLDLNDTGNFKRI